MSGNQWGRSAAGVAGVALAAGVLVVVVNRLTPDRPAPGHPADRGRSAELLRPVAGPYSDVDHLGRIAPIIGPVPLSSTVALGGDPRFSARLEAGPGADPSLFTVRVRNVGSAPIDASFSTGGLWLESTQGRSIPAAHIRLLPTGSGSPSALGPGAEVRFEVVFTVPADVRPAQLTASLTLGDYQPYARWDLAGPLPTPSRRPGNRS